MSNKRENGHKNGNEEKTLVTEILAILARMTETERTELLDQLRAAYPSK